MHLWAATYPNLGAESTQRAKGFHKWLTMPMHNLQPVPSTAATVVRRVLVQLQDLRRVAADDQQRTFQAIDTAELEFRATARKVQAAAQEEREEYQKIQIPCGGVIVEEEEEEVVWEQEEANLNDKEALSDATAQRCLEAPSENPGYLSECVLPLRWGLPCRHWMLASAATNISLPFSLIHLQWHFEPPVEFSGAWSMSWVPAEQSEEEKTKRQEAALNRLRLDPLRNHGEDRAKSSAYGCEFSQSYEANQNLMADNSCQRCLHSTSFA